ncbi:hypothetical protein [Rummeliibacillus pycnus]|uniref:hypothetical protein n=1 Tax=Rummeliibacillus pycnus TaxID=101070 RepID=UPI000C9BF44A|nr:hypothetical protein [Rummeliibacillus pycnus]
MKKNIVLWVVLICFTLVCVIQFINYQNNDEEVKSKNNNIDEVFNVGGKSVTEEALNEFKETNLKLASFIKENNSNPETQVSEIQLDTNNFPKSIIYIDVLPNKSINTEEVKEHYLKIIEKAKSMSLLNKDAEIEIIIETDVKK